MAEIKDFLAKTFASVTMPVQGSSSVVPSTTPFFNPGQQTPSGATSFGLSVTLASDPGDLVSSIHVAFISAFNNPDGAVSVYGSPVSQFVNQQPAMTRSSSHFYSFASQPTAQAVSVPASASASSIPGFSIASAMSAIAGHFGSNSC